MSDSGVQRAIVRMMFDPAFRDAVYDDPAAALAGCDVTEEERGWLVRPDRRAYATDRTRQARALLAIEEELPAAMAWARGEGRVMEDFFAADELHRCIEARGVLTLAFAAWLERGASTALWVLVRLEAAVARARRGEVRDPDIGAGGKLVLAPRVALLVTGEDALTWWPAVREAARAGRALPPPAFGPSSPAGRLGEPCAVLIGVDRDGDARAQEIPLPLAELLGQLGQPRPRGELEHYAVRQGLTPDDAREVIDELLADGVLAAAGPA